MGEINIIFDETKSKIAALAQDASNQSGSMIVIGMPSLLSWGGSKANRAAMILTAKKGFPFIEGETVFPQG